MKSVLLTILLLINFSLIAENAFKRVLTDLPSKMIYYIYQDSKGFIWVLTDNGVARYDGDNLKIFTTKDGLADNENFQVHEDSNGNLWFLSYTGKIAYYSYMDRKFHSIETGINSIGIHNPLRSFFEINGFVYLANAGSIFKISLKDYTLVKTIKTDKDQTAVYFFEKENQLHFLSPKGIFVIVNSRIVEKRLFLTRFYGAFYTQRMDQENFVFTTRKGLYKLNIKNLQYQHILKTEHIGEVQKIGNSITLNTSNGILWLNENLEIVKRAHADKAVFYCYTDADHNNWIGTGNKGLFLQKATSFSKTNVTNEEVMVFGKNHTSYATFGDTVVNNKSKLHITTNRRIKKFKYRKYGYYILANQLSQWEKNGVLKKYDVGNRDFQFHNDSTVISVRSHGVIISQFHNFCDNWDKMKLAIKVSSEPTRIFPFKNSIYLLGTINGLSLFDVELRKEKKIPIDHVLFGKYEITYINRYKNSFYIGTKDNGLFKINAALDASSIVHYPILNTIKEVQLLHDKIYVLSNKLYEVDANGHIYEIPNDHEEIININDIIVDNDTLWLATNSGIYSYQEKKKILNKPVVKSFLVDNEAVDINKEITIPPSNKTLQVDFTSPHTNSYALYYQFALLSNTAEDTLWTNTKGSEIILKNLPKGSYQLVIRASLDKQLNSQSKLTSISFVVLPFFYQTWWFYLLCFINVGLFIYFFFYVNILSYNRDITRKLILALTAKLKHQKTIGVRSVLDGSIKNIPINTINYVKAENKHMLFYLTDGKRVESRVTLKELKETLDKVDKTFIQTHRSYLVNKKKVEGVHATFVQVGEEKIPVGRAHKDSVSRLLQA